MGHSENCEESDTRYGGAPEVIREVCIKTQGKTKRLYDEMMGKKYNIDSF